MNTSGTVMTLIILVGVTAIFVMVQVASLYGDGYGINGKGLDE